MSAVAVAEDRPPAAICDPAVGIGRVAAPDPRLAAARFSASDAIRLPARNLDF